MSSLSVHFGTDRRYLCHKQRVNDCMGPHNVSCSYVDDICGDREVIFARICSMNETNGAIYCAELPDYAARELFSSYVAGALFQAIFKGRPLELRQDLNFAENADSPAENGLRLCLSPSCTEEESVPVPLFASFAITRVSSELSSRMKALESAPPCSP